MTTIQADHVVPVPWKNGGGVTRDLLLLPAGDAWRVRISLADIDRDGPFSAFPGVERWFAVVQGAGVRLSFDDSEVRVGPHDHPLRFDGAHAPGCQLLDGRTRDLNLMLRGGARGVMVRGTPDEAGSATWPLQFRFDTATLELSRVVPSAPLAGALLPLPLAAEGWGAGLRVRNPHLHPNPLPPSGRGGHALWIGVAP